MMIKGVIQEIIEAGGLMSKLPGATILGTQATYNRESTLPTGNFYAPGEEYSNMQVAAYSQVATELKEYGGQYKMPRKVARTYRDPNMMQAVADSQATKGLKRDTEGFLLY